MYGLQREGCDQTEEGGGNQATTEDGVECNEAEEVGGDQVLIDIEEDCIPDLGHKQAEGSEDDEEEVLPGMTHSFVM